MKNYVKLGRIGLETRRGLAYKREHCTLVMSRRSNEQIVTTQPILSLFGQLKNGLLDLSVLDQLEASRPVDIETGTTSHTAKTLRHFAQRVRHVGHETRQNAQISRVVQCSFNVLKEKMKQESHSNT